MRTYHGGKVTIPLRLIREEFDIATVHGGGGKVDASAAAASLSEIGHIRNF